MGFLGALFSLFGLSRHIHVIDDMCPEVAVQLGYFARRSLFAIPCRKATKWILDHSDYIAVTSDSLKRQVMGRYNIS